MASLEDKSNLSEMTPDEADKLLSSRFVPDTDILLKIVSGKASATLTVSCLVNF